MGILRKVVGHPEIYPLIGIIGFAGGFAVYCAGRALFTYPDVVLDHKRNPSPWLNIKQNEQRKMYQTYDYISGRKEFPEVPK